ncbi:MAG TPA: gliding motility protein GldC [Trueperaceae bacterium]|nr:gliding motility protein GldC [Trueperaceae bacterium]
MLKSSDINLRVLMDDDGIEEIRWRADDGPGQGEQIAKAMILALWDPEARSALRIDLWTKEMPVDDMNDFFFQTFMSLADTYKNATNDANLAGEIKVFAQEFASRASKNAARQVRTTP